MLSGEAMKKNDKITVITCAAAFALNVALFSVKLYVGLCANSISIYSDAVNNMFDSLSGLAAFICFAALLSSSSEGTRAIIKKAEQFFSFVMSVIILLTGLYFAYNSLERLFYPTPISYLTRYLVMLIVTVAVKFIMFFAYRGVYRITGSPIIKVMAADSILDCFITLATVMSLTVSQYVEFAVDAVFGLVISTVLITSAVKLAKKSGAVMLDFVGSGKREEISEIFDSLGVAVDYITYRRTECHTTEAVRIFNERGMTDKVKLLETSGSIYTYYYSLEDTIDYYYGNLLPSTGFIWLFDIVKYYDGLLLRIPNRQNPNVLEEVVKQEKMLDVFKEHLRWNYIMGLSNVGDFNLACEEGHATDLINVAEALQEKKIAQIADDIYNRGENGNRVKLVLISGPSSSGKTTFSKRLSVQLMTNGLRPYPIALDNYFVNREDTPRDVNGDYDYESLYALDLKKFEEDLKALLRGEEIDLPSFNFSTGQREYKGDKLRIDEHTILILEGIHALNPELTPQIPAENKYKIYVSALTTISLDDHNWIPTTDNRLLRRIIRDFNYRGYSARETISRWPSVRAGEDKWIFPYQENADVMFNSALLFEFAVLRCHAEPILTSVPRNCPEYAEAYRLLKFIKYFTPVQDKEIPPTSLLREFLGGSSFKY